MVLAFAGATTITRSTWPAPLRTAGAAERAGRFLLTAAAGAPAFFAGLVFLRPDVTGAALSGGCFLRAGTGLSLVAVVLPSGLATIAILGRVRHPPIL